MKNICITDYNVAERTKKAFEYDETRCNPDFSVIYVSEGDCEISFNTGEFIIFPERSVALVPSYTLARIRHTPGTVSGRCKELRLNMSVNIDGCSMDDLFVFPRVFPREESEKIFVLLNTIKDNDNVFRAYSNLYRLLELMLKYSSVKTEKYFLKEIYEYILMNSDKQIKVSELAEVVGASEPTVYRMFAHVAGCTPIDYINTYRIGKAHSMLGGGTDAKIKAVAAACGFDDQLYFSKLYSKAYGMSPRAYRRSLESN